MLFPKYESILYIEIFMLFNKLNYSIIIKNLSELGEYLIIFFMEDGSPIFLPYEKNQMKCFCSFEMG